MAKAVTAKNGYKEKEMNMANNSFFLEKFWQ